MWSFTLFIEISFVRSDISDFKNDQSDQYIFHQIFLKGLHLESFTNEKYVGK